MTVKPSNNRSSDEDEKGGGIRNRARRRRSDIVGGGEHDALGQGRGGWKEVTALLRTKEQWWMGAGNEETAGRRWERQELAV